MSNKRNKNMFVCENCGHVNDKKKRNDKNKKISDMITLDNEVNKKPDLPILVEITHCGFWITDNSGTHITTTNQQCDRNSVMLSHNCLLYIYKIALRHLLLSTKIITPQDIDPANLIPHVKVRNNK